jgi:transposase
MNDTQSPKSVDQLPPNSEVVPQAERKRRRLTRAYKLKILRRVEELKPGSSVLGAFLRKEGLYSSHIFQWKKERESGKLNADVRRGPKPKRSELELQHAALMAEHQKLKRRNEQAEKLIEAQKKIAQFLGSLVQKEPNQSS